MGKILCALLLAGNLLLPKLTFTKLSVEDGLSQCTIFDIVQDTNLNMWFATYDGLCRYDGYDFKVYRLDGECMVAAMELCRDSLYARKAWFFCPEGILCLGAGISSKHPGRIITTVNQCIAKDDFLSGGGWVFQDGITYISLDGKKLKATSGERRGNWKMILDKASGSTVKGNVFEVIVDHGEFPKDATYAYFISPLGTAPAKAAKSVKSSVKILSNTPDLQKVQIFGHEFCVDWNAL